MYESLSANFLASNAAPRQATLDGRKYLVAPMTMIVPGVLAGSKGPLFYPPDEVGRNPQVWNETPIVLYHPTDANGNPISAKTPGVLDMQGLGRVRRSIYNGKHVAEAWFDTERLDAVDNEREKQGKPKLRPRLERGEKIEISTGLYTEDTDTPGEYNGKAYTAIARNYRPDHLAVLPDMPGACSINDGCGVNNQARHQDSGQYLNDKGVSQKQPAAAAKKGYAAAHGTGEPTKPGDEDEEIETNGGPGSGPHKGGATIATKKAQAATNETGNYGGSNSTLGDRDEAEKIAGHALAASLQGQNKLAAKYHGEASEKHAAIAAKETELGNHPEAVASHTKAAELHRTAKDYREKLSNNQSNGEGLSMFPENDPHAASKQAAAASVMSEHDAGMKHGLNAMRKSGKDDHEGSAADHISAAEEHEQAATEERKKKGGSDDVAAQHDNTAAMHRRAASLHGATVNRGDMSDPDVRKAVFARLAEGGEESQTAKKASDKADKSGKAEHHRAAATAHREAAEHHRDEGNKEHAAAHLSAAKAHERKARSATNNEETMKLTDNERKGIIAQLAANCACEKDQALFNGMSDNGLLALKNNMKEKKKEEDDSEMEDNAGKKPDSSNADETGGGSVESGGYEKEDKPGKGLTKNTRKPITERLTPAEQEVWNSAAQIHTAEKRRLAIALTANVADKAKREILVNRLVAKPLAELQEQVSYFPRSYAPPPQAPAPSFLGNAGGPDLDAAPPTTNHHDPELLLDEPTINYEELVAEQRNARKQPVA